MLSEEKTIKNILFVSLTTICLSFFAVNSANASNFDYGYIAGVYVESGYTFEASIGGSGTENGFYGRALGLFIDFGEEDYGVVATASGDILFANAGYHGNGGSRCLTYLY